MFADNKVKTQFGVAHMKTCVRYKSRQKGLQHVNRKASSGACGKEKNACNHELLLDGSKEKHQELRSFGAVPGTPPKTFSSLCRKKAKKNKFFRVNFGDGIS